MSKSSSDINIERLKKKMFKSTDDDSGKKWEIVFRKFNKEKFTVRLTIYNGKQCIECSCQYPQFYEVNANNVKNFEDLSRLFSESPMLNLEMSKLLCPKVESIEEII